MNTSQPSSALGGIRIALLSDLHVFHPEAAKADERPYRPSLIEAGRPPSNLNEDPVRALCDLIQTEGLQADVLLFGGDLADRAHPAAILHGWTQVQSIATAMKVKGVLGTSGNHDIDSRHSYNKYDAKGYLRTLNPPFPVTIFDDINTTTQMNLEYWARHFTSIRMSGIRFLILNSAAFHGGHPEELGRGRISSYTLAEIEHSLRNEADECSASVLLCHHHPHQHSNLKLGDTDVMTDGELLLSLLDSGEFGEWIVIHGHKHHPRIIYAQGSASSPLVFAAGSFSRELYHELQTRARNQFYVIELFPHALSTGGLCGTFTAWDWSHGIGWIAAGANSGLPASGGFGCRQSASTLATAIANCLGQSASLAWSSLADKLPQLRFLLPVDIAKLIAKLKLIGFEVVMGSDGAPAQVVKS